MSRSGGPRHRGLRAGTAVTLRCDAEGVRLVVRDQGPGIPAEARDRVVERFYRHAPGPTGGSGLGLAIVAEVARRHAAVLALRDGPTGSGLDAEVTFPPTRCAAAPAAQGERAVRRSA